MAERIPVKLSDSEWSVTSDSESDGTCDQGKNTNEYITPLKRKYKRRLYDGNTKKRSLIEPSKAEDNTNTLRHSSSDSLEFLESGNSSTDNSDESVSSLSATISDYSPSDESEEDDISCSGVEISEGESYEEEEADEEDIYFEDDENKCDRHAKEPLYDGSELTILSAHVLIMLFVLKHSLTKDAFVDLLDLLKVLLPPKNGLIASVFKLKAFLQRTMNQVEPKIHSICESCGRLLNGNCDQPSCIRKGNLVKEFYDLNVEGQLKELFKDEQFCTLVQERREDQTTLSDVRDGAMYKKVSTEEDFFKHRSVIHLTFSMNTDGVAIYSSSKKGNLWPVYLAINELPVTLRFSKRYILPCLLHCHVEKPDMLTYLSPLVQFFNMFYEQGIEMATAIGKVLVRGRLLLVAVDLPARALVLNMKQFNGKHGCSVCTDEGKNPPNQPLQRYYPYTENYCLRTNDSLKLDARTAAEKGDAVNGVKGASILFALKYGDLPSMFAIDWMHCVHLGVVKLLIGLWIGAKNKNANFYIGDKVEVINSRLLGIKTPDFVHRQQRSIEEYTHWKATECREWLIHFSIPVLFGILEGTVFAHYMLLVTGMAILSSEVIEDSRIEIAGALLDDFTRLFPVIYGEKKQTMNIHMLRHLPHFSKLYGPLFGFSCYGFESMNSHLKSMVHGTRFINSQICFAVATIKGLPALVTNAVEETSCQKARKLFKQLTGKWTGSDNCRKEWSPVGKKLLVNLSQEQRTAIGTAETSGLKFFRLYTPFGMLFCTEYERVSRKTSYAVQVIRDGDVIYGNIVHFLNIANEIYSAVEIYEQAENSPFQIPQNVNFDHTDIYKDLLLSHIVRLNPKSSLLYVKAKYLKRKCVLIKIKNHLYMSVPPNTLEHS